MVKKQLFIKKIIITSGIPKCEKTIFHLVKPVFKRIFLRDPTESLAKTNIREFGTSQGKPLGYMLTFRKNPVDLLKKILVAVKNTLPYTSVGMVNTVSFGITSHLAFPGQKISLYEGIVGFNVNVVFTYPGSRVIFRRRDRLKRLPNKIKVTRDEMITYFNNLKVSFV